jgi:hypothetical protein
VASTLRLILKSALLLVLASACTRGAVTPPKPTIVEPNLGATNSPSSLKQYPSPDFINPPENVITTPAPGLLPNSIYFLNDMGTGASQIWKLSRDGATLTQITFEGASVTDFAISATSGALAYITNNRLYYAEAANGKSSLLVDGGEISENNINQGNDSSTQRISSPRWSSNGKSLAYGYRGINIFQPGNGKNTRLLRSGFLESWDGSGNKIQAEYSPYAWSPDNRLLAIEIDLEGKGSTLGIFSLANGSLVRLHQPSTSTADDLVCCQASWSQDNKHLYVANFYVSLPRPAGLWVFDIESGAGTILIPSDEKDGTHNYAGWPIQLKDGGLVYWFTSTPDRLETESPMQPVSTGQDAVSNRTMLRPEAILPEEVLWADQAQLAVIVQTAPGTATRKIGGPAILIKWDGSSAQPLISNGYRLQWGP